MNRQRLTKIASSVIEGFNPADIDRPIRETRLDSLDLMLLRSALETEMGAQIRDEDWFESTSLAQLMTRLP